MRYNIVNENKDSFTKKIEQMIEEKKKNYEKSTYYQWYLSYYNSTDKYAQELISEFKKWYAINEKQFHDPFYDPEHKNLKKHLNLDIGYPVHDDYLEALKLKFKESFDTFNDIQNSEIEISVHPIEFEKIGENLYREVNKYSLEIELVNKLKKEQEHGKTK